MTQMNAERFRLATRTYKEARRLSKGDVGNKQGWVEV